MTDHPFASLDNHMLTMEYIKACIREEVELELDSDYTLADVITEALNRGLTMDDLEEMSIQLGY